MHNKEIKMIIPVTCGDAKHIELDKWIKHIKYESGQPGISASRHLNMPNVAKRMSTPHTDSCLFGQSYRSSHRSSKRPRCTSPLYLSWLRCEWIALQIHKQLPAFLRSAFVRSGVVRNVVVDQSSQEYKLRATNCSCALQGYGFGVKTLYT